MNALAVFLVAAIALLPVARADRCYYDLYGNYYCNGLSTGARIGIGIGVFVGGLLLIILLGWMRRRRINRINKSYIAQQQSQGLQSGSGPGTGGPGSQYPPQVSQPQYAPPPGAPPQVAAPNGPPAYKQEV